MNSSSDQITSQPSDTVAIESQTKPQRKRFRLVIPIIALIIIFGVLGYQIELVLPARSPALSNTYTPQTQVPPS